MANAKPTRLGDSEAQTKQPQSDKPAAAEPEVTTEEIDSGPGRNKTRKTVVKRGKSTTTFYRH